MSSDASHQAARLLELLQDLDVLAWEADGTTLKLAFVVGSDASLLGFSRQKWLEERFFAEHLHPDDRETFLAILAATGRTPRRVACRFVAANGSIVWFQVTVRRSEEGPCIHGLMIDLTARAEAMGVLAGGEARSRLVLEQMPLIVWTTDREMRFSSGAGGGLKALGLRPDQFAGVPVAAYLAQPDETDNAALRATRAAVEGAATSFDSCWAGRDYQTHIEPFRDSSGAIVGSLGIALDITERKGAERQLARSVALLRATLDATADGILVVDRQGRIVDANARFAEMWGGDLPGGDFTAEAIRAHVERRVEDPAHVLARLDEIYAHPDEPSFDVLTFRDGRILERYSQAERVDGVSVGRVFSFHDVTDARRAAERSAFLAEATRLLASSLDDRAALAGLARLAVPTLADTCVIDVIGESGERRRVAAYPDDAAPGLAETEPQLGVGERSLRVPMIAHGRAAGFITFVRGERRRRYDRGDAAMAEEVAQRAAFAVENARLYREARAAIGSRDEFLSIAAHELRTPCTSLLLGVQSLRRIARTSGLAAAPEGYTARVLATAERQTRNLARLIDKLLDVSRIAEGRLTLELEEVDLREVVDAVVADFREELDRRGITLTVSGEGPIAGRWDRIRIEQVVANLVANAIKYGEEKPIRIEVARVGDVARLVVRDRGMGIPADRLPHVFERFERAVSSRNFGGLGLGLYITGRILERHGATISVTSAVGEGTTFTVTLPAEPSKAAAAGGTGAVGPITPSSSPSLPSAR